MVRHQQCVFHVLYRARDLGQVQAGRAWAFPRQVITLFQERLEVRDLYLGGRTRRGRAASGARSLRRWTSSPCRSGRARQRRQRASGQAPVPLRRAVADVFGGPEHPGDQPPGRAGLEDADRQPQGLGRQPQRGQRRGAVRAAIDLGHDANSKPSRSWNSCATVSAAYWASCSSRQRCAEPGALIKHQKFRLAFCFPAM